MTDSTAEFFEDLGRRGQEPLLGRTTGTIRFDLADGARTEHWLVAVTKGNVAVSRNNAGADCVVRTEKALFDDIASGRANMMAATLRGVLAIEGDTGLLVRFQRLFPAPVSAPAGSPERTVSRQRS